jgi:hypothetical protein
MKKPISVAAILWLVLALAACGSDGKGKADVAGDLPHGADTPGNEPDSRVAPNSPAFTYNGDVCKIGPAPLSAVTSKVDAGIPLMDAFAARLIEEGYDVYRGPENPVEPPPAGDVTPGTADVQTRDVSVPTDVFYGPPDTLADILPDLSDEPGWEGGQYLVARTPLSDLIFLLESGTIGVVSWCPAHSLGQIRRLDFTLADAVRLFGDVAAYDYANETERWTLPVAYYTAVEGTYQRSYMNGSLAIGDPHDGQLSISGKPVMAGFVLYGHADAPSQAGDEVGMDLLQVGPKVLAENESDTVTGQVVRLWDFSSLAGEGELPVIVDAFVSDTTTDWLVGVYYIFADAVFPDTAHGSFVLTLQGAPPGKLMVSKDISTLLIPPLAPLF